MDESALRSYLFEIERQLTFGLLARKEVISALENADTTRVWYAVQSLLTASANVSRLLWPAARNSSKDLARKRGEALRRELGVKDENVLRLRTLRDHFEHFDERMDTWASRTEGKELLADSNIGPPDFFRFKEHLRFFDTDNFSILFADTRYELNPICDAMSRLYESVEMRLKRQQNEYPGISKIRQDDP